MPEKPKKPSRPIDIRIRRLFEERRGTETFRKAVHVQVIKHILSGFELPAEQLREATMLAAHQCLLVQAGRHPVSAHVARIILKRGIMQVQEFAKSQPLRPEQTAAAVAVYGAMLKRLQNAEPRQPVLFDFEVLQDFDFYNDEALKKLLGKKRFKKFYEQEGKEIRKAAPLLKWSPDSN